MTNKPDELPPLPMRTVATALPDSMIDQLDAIRRNDDDLPSRSAIIREAVTMYLELHAMPPQITMAICDMIQTARMIAETADEIGEAQGTA